MTSQAATFPPGGEAGPHIIFLRRDSPCRRRLASNGPQKIASGWSPCTAKNRIPLSKAQGIIPSSFVNVMGWLRSEKPARLETTISRKVAPRLLSRKKANRTLGESAASSFLTPAPRSSGPASWSKPNTTRSRCPGFTALANGPSALHFGADSFSPASSDALLRLRALYFILRFLQKGNFPPVREPYNSVKDSVRLTMCAPPPKDALAQRSVLKLGRHLLRHCYDEGRHPANSNPAIGGLKAPSLSARAVSDETAHARPFSKGSSDALYRNSSRLQSSHHMGFFAGAVAESGGPRRRTYPGKRSRLLPAPRFRA